MRNTHTISNLTSEPLKCSWMILTFWGLMMINHLICQWHWNCVCVCVSGVSGWGGSAAAAPAGPDSSELPPAVLLLPPQTHQPKPGLFRPCGHHVSTHLCVWQHTHTHLQFRSWSHQKRSPVYDVRCETGVVTADLWPPAETLTCSTSQCWSCLTLRLSPPTDQVSDAELRADISNIFQHLSTTQQLKLSDRKTQMIQ